MANHSFLLAAPESTLSQAPTTGEVSADRFFRSLAAVAASLVLLLVAYIVWKIGGQALPAIERFHVGFLTASDWNVQTEKFGVLPEIWGTLYSSLLALILGGFFGITVAIFLTQDFLPTQLAVVFRTDHRAAGGHSQRGLRPLGHLRRHPVASARRRLAARDLGWLPFFCTSLAGPGWCRPRWCWRS